MEDKKDKVDNQHPKYEATATARQTYIDVLSGTEAMRSESYLFKMPKEDNTDYAYRQKQARLQNLTAKTLETLCGLVFEKDITLGDDVPPEIEKLWENIDNKGTHGNVFCRDIFEDSFDGWACILVDTPTAKANDLGEQKALGIRPYWVAYDACDVINWDYAVNEISRKTELSLIVFRECKTVKKGMFLREDVTQYRVFYLENGKVYWQLWEEQKGEDGKAKTLVQIQPDTLIEKMKAIPVAVVGELGDKPPLIDIAYANIDLLNSYSDHKNNIHQCNFPVKVATGVQKEDLPSSIGPNTLILSGNADAKFSILEPSGTSIKDSREFLQDIKADIASMGLAMLAGKTQKGDVTATERMLDSIQETSALQVRATQLKDAIELALSFTAQYLGKDDGGSIEMGATWQQMVLSPQELTALSGLVDAGQMSLESFLWHLQRSEKLPPDVDVDEEMKRIDKEMKENAGVKPVINAIRQPNENAQNTPPTPLA